MRCLLSITRERSRLEAALTRPDVTPDQFLALSQTLDALILRQMRLHRVCAPLPAMKRRRLTGARACSRAFHSRADTPTYTAGAMGAYSSSETVSRESSSPCLSVSTRVT